MIHVDLPFVGQVGIYLENFTQKNQYLWNCSCPICGDMSKSKKKKRFYIYRPGNANHLNAKCHHCGYSTSFGSFLKEKFPQQYKEYSYIRYQETSRSHVPHNDFAETIKKVITPIPKKIEDLSLVGLKRCDTIKDTHPVAKFLAKRLIPADKWGLIYYTTKFNEYTNRLVPGKIPETSEEHPRLIIPYFNDKKKMFAFAARAFDGRQPRYYTIKLNDSERIYGLDRIKEGKVYAVEGAIDSLFLPNAVAVSGANFDCETIREMKDYVTIVPDNEPRSKEICKLIRKHIKLGYSVCMLPHSILTKDINEHILNGRTADEVKKLIDENTYRGAAAILKFNSWKMV